MQIRVGSFTAPESARADDFVIRSYKPGDGERLYEAVNASFLHLNSMPWAVVDQSVEASEQICREFRGRYLMGSEFVLSIWNLDETRLLGGSGFHLREGSLQSGNAEIGMWIRAEEAHHGLGTRVLVALLRWGFSEWPWQRITWRCSGANVASQRVAEKAGMLKEGVLRSHRVAADGSRQDTFCYAALRREWNVPTS
jgi:RimJ/RimL family protein N-acetyltransferase